MYRLAKKVDKPADTIHEAVLCRGKIQISMTSEIPFLSDRLAEAARYALMRRLLPGIRHNIASSMQPVSMMAAMMERRLRVQAPDLPELAKSSQALNTLSREAVAASLNLMNWLAPKHNHPVAVNSAVDEALGLVSTDLSFRGFSIVNQTLDLPACLPQGIVRSVFIACVIALTDRAEAAADVVVSAKLNGNQTQLTIRLEAGGKAELAGMEAPAQAYRSLDWDDVQALADAEGVELEYDMLEVRLRH